MKKTLLFALVVMIFSTCKKKEDIKKTESTIVVNFQSEKKSISEGDTVIFTNLSKSSDSIVNYNWTFIGGTPEKSTEKNPKITYNNFGKYAVKLIVSNKFKKDSLILDSFVNVSVKVKETLDVKFDTQTKSIFEDESISLLNLSTSSTPDITYDWTFIGGIPAKSSEKNPIVKYDKSGNYDIKLVVSSKTKKDSLISRDFISVKSSLNKGLLLYYPLNGNANDYSGNNINGTLSSLATTTSGKAGALNSAYQFMGNSSSFIQIPTNKLQISTFSYCMWVYLDELPSYGDQYMPFSIGSVGGDQHFQAMNNVHDGHGWAFGGYSENYPAFFKSSGLSIQSKKWYLLVVTRTNNKLNLYVDCNLVTEESSTSSRVAFYGFNQVIAKLGCRFDGAYPLKGKIDEFRIYNRALTPLDISRLCEKGPTSSEFQ